MSCDTGRIPTIQEYCAHRLDHVPYADDVKPDSCYERVENDQEKGVESCLCASITVVYSSMLKLDEPFICPFRLPFVS